MASAASVVIDGRNMVAGSSSGNRRADIAGSSPAVTTFLLLQDFFPNERNVALIRLIGSGRSQAE